MNSIILANGLAKTGMPVAVNTLKQQKLTLDIIQEGLMATELDPQVPHVGIGGAPNLLGELETDASLMDGDSLQVGAVGALKGYKSAAWLARKVMEELPHNFIVGEGARRFAAEMGAEAVGQLPGHVQSDYQNWLKENVSAEDLKLWPELPLAKYTSPALEPLSKSRDESEKDTVVFLCRNQQGSHAAGSSTSGWNYKYPGRLGDAPVIGAGVYADSEYGSCVCTYTGEMTMRCCTAHSVVFYMKKGASVADACQEAIFDLKRLKGGYQGIVVVHALSRTGEPFVATNTNNKITYYQWQSDLGDIECKYAVNCS